MRVARSRRALGAAVAVSLLGIVLVAKEARATDAPHDVTRLPNRCSDCHVGHNAPGMGLTNVAGNFNLCNSCHVANGRPTWAAGDQAIPGTSGSSHGWSQNEVNATYGASQPTNNDLIEHSDGFTSNNPIRKVKCSTCHDPHQQTATPFDPAAPASPTAAGRHFMRINNTANQLCMDCHTARNLTDAGHGSWTGANLSHPVLVANPATASFFNPPREAGGAAQLAVNVGTATGGSLTTLTDSTKAWAVNGLVGQWIRFTSGSNKNVTRAITANGATQVTFATVAPGPAIAAGVTYEIDADGNLTNNVVLDNAGTPSFTAGNVQCLSCHGVHNADSNASTYDDQPRPGDGMLLRRANDDTACTACHTVQLHNSTTTGSSRPAWGASFTCRTCHRPHGTPNIHLVNQSISTPNSGVKAVDFRRMANGIENQGLVNQADPGSGPCEVCHTDTRNGGDLTTPGTATFTQNNVTVTGVGTTWASQLAAGWEIRCTQGGSSPGAWTRIVAVNSNTSLTLSGPGYKGASCAAGSSWQAANPRFRNSPSGRGAAGTEHYAGLCTTCHTHAGGFKGGESSGNTPCTTCHDFDMVIDDAARTTKYHHVMEIDDKLTAGITTYPTSATPTVATADQDKSCVQCHADHNIFRPDLNASNSAGRGANLRSRILNGPPTGSPPAPSAPGDAAAGYYTDRDFDNAYTGGGICLSCHTSMQTKNVTDQASDGTTVTLALAKATFTASAHAFNVAGRITTGPGPFNVACTKCHNDEQTKGYQDGTWKFSLHATNERRLLGSLGITAPTDPLEEKFCFRCHSAVADVTPGGGPVKGVTLRDYYNATAMTARSEGIYAQFQKGVPTSLTTTNTLYFKPWAQEQPAEPMPNLQAVEGTTFATDTLYFKNSTQETPAEPMPNAYILASGTYTATTYRGRIMTPVQGSAVETVTLNTTNGSGLRFNRVAQIVSPPIATGFTWNAGQAITLTMRNVENNGNNNCNLRWAMYRWNAADTQGTQFENVTDGAEFPTAVANTNYTVTLDSAVTFAAGDKLLLEVEVRANSPTNTGTCTLTWGGATENSRLLLPGTSLGNLPEFTYTAPVVAGGTWVGRTMSPGVPTAANETRETGTMAVAAGTTLWRRASFVSPPLAAAATTTAASWTIAVYDRESSANANARGRYRIYRWSAADTQGVDLVPWTTWGTEMGTATALQTFTTPVGAAVALAIGDKLVLDLEVETIAVVTGGNYNLEYTFGSTSQSRLVGPDSLTFNYASPATGSQHGVATYSGLHRPSATDETLAYVAANKHVECADCHDPHGAGSGVHTQGTNLVSGALSNVSGVTATYSGTNWTAPTMGATLTTATKEHEICYKCHSAANTSLATWNAAWTNVALEFSTSNQSYHPVAGALPAADPGANGSSRLTAGQLAGGWTPGQTMYCSDCHGNDAAAPAAQGPHGSAVSFILKGPNVYWPTNSAGVLYDTGNNPGNNAFLSGLFCMNCHPLRNNLAANSTANWSGNLPHYEHSGPQLGNVACVRCHILVPHGGKMSRLIGDRDGTMPARYAYQGTLTNMYIQSFTKNTPGSYQKGNCQSNASGCTTHSTAAGENW